MPHIVLENINSTKEAFDAVEPFAQKIEGGILKVMDKYINASEQTALVESLAIENGNNQNFFVQLSQKKSSLTVRLLPLTDPEKTNGVKQIMAQIAKQIKDTDQSIAYGKNNLEDFLL
jgi:CHASE3 domain sensor protein